jgi:hypothetical protein
MATSPARRLLYRVADAGASLYGDYQSRRTEFLAHERTPIASARMGELVKVVGRLRGNGWEYKAPLSAKPCLWYRTVVKKFDVPAVPPLVGAAAPFAWPILLPEIVIPALAPVLARFKLGKTITEEESVDLFLEDDSGSAVIDARSAQFSLVAMRSGWESDSWQGDAAGRLLERYAVPPSGKLLYREVFLKEGDRVAVLGRPRTELDPTSHGDFRTPPTRIVFDEPGQVLVSDEPGVF